MLRRLICMSTVSQVPMWLLRRFLTDEGIEYLREYLNLPSEIVPATLKKSTRPLERGGYVSLLLPKPYAPLCYKAPSRGWKPGCDDTMLAGGRSCPFLRSTGRHQAPEPWPYHLITCVTTAPCCCDVIAACPCKRFGKLRLKRRAMRNSTHNWLTLWVCHAPLVALWVSL